MRRWTAPTRVERLLVVKPSSLGDIFHVFPALALLRRVYPEAELDFLIHPAFREVLDYSPFPVTNRILFNRAELGRARSFTPEFFRLLRSLRRRRYDLVIDFQGLFRSALFAALAAGPRPVGFARPRERLARLFYHAGLRVPVDGHAVERNVALVNRLTGSDFAVPEPRLPESPAAAEKVAAKLRSAGVMDGERLIGVMPGARWRSKQFPVELFRRVLTPVVAAPGVRAVLIGGPAESELGRALEDLPGAVNLIGRTSLGEMVELLRRCRTVLSNDSGPVHAAAALGLPVCCFFGPTDAAKTGPYGSRHHIFTAEAECAPCLTRRCPRFSDPVCHRIAPEPVTATLLTLVRD